MGKPYWMRKKEEEEARIRKLRKCVNCAVGGDPCGVTNNLGGSRGRLTTYQCRKFPTIVFHEGTFACEHYEPRGGTNKR